MELILEKIPESVKKRMADEERMLRKEESCLVLEREATTLWRLRQLELTPVVRPRPLSYIYKQLIVLE